MYNPYDAWQIARTITPPVIEDIEYYSVAATVFEGYIRLEFFDIRYPEKGIIYAYTGTTDFARGLGKQLEALIYWIENEDF